MKNKRTLYDYFRYFSKIIQEKFCRTVFFLLLCKPIRKNIITNNAFLSMCLTSIPMPNALDYQRHDPSLCHGEEAIIYQSYIMCIHNITNYNRLIKNNLIIFV